MNINKIVFVILFFSCVSLHAQKYETHAVKQGETLESIAKHYRVTPYSILSLNPEVKDGVKANTILIVPLAEQQTTGEQPQTGQPGEVTRFITHKVNRKETLYGISKQYYNYMFTLISQSGESLGPFVTQPATVKGNIINMSNPENYALGYFRVSQEDTYTYVVD